MKLRVKEVFKVLSVIYDGMYYSWYDFTGTADFLSRSLCTFYFINVTIE